MLTKEMMGRLKRAGEYQKKAILELLPEGMEGHVDVIVREVKLMALEVMEDLAKECMQGFVSCSAGWQKTKGEAESQNRESSNEKVRKVTID